MAKRAAEVHMSASAREKLAWHGDARRALRELLFTAPDVLQFLSGVILFEETLYQKIASGKPFFDVLKEGGVLPGIKVDKGTVELAGTKDETIERERVGEMRKRASEMRERKRGELSWREDGCEGVVNKNAPKKNMLRLKFVVSYQDIERDADEESLPGLPVPGKFFSSPVLSACHVPALILIFCQGRIE